MDRFLIPFFACAVLAACSPSFGSSEPPPPQVIVLPPGTTVIPAR